jgi:2-keto-4-pentenoate hydratase/2-oxohepta-3-ene-1,7-dioic acid hydratase in catechol pathway
MRLARFGEAGSERPAAFDADGILRDVSGDVEDYDARFFAGDGLARVAAALQDAAALPAVDPAAVRVGAPIAQPPKIVCIGLNYADHAQEAGFTVPDEPMIFLKAPNSLVGPYDDVRIPRGGERVDWEVELAVVIGREARYLPDEAAALDVIAGYAVVDDLSERVFQLERGGEWTKGKSCETFNPLGPWLVTPDEVADPQALDMWLTVNGEEMQRSSTSNMVFGVAHLIWYLSQFMVLEPGDLIDTGTPGGVGNLQKPPRFLTAGDVIELGVGELGTQRSAVVAADG